MRLVDIDEESLKNTSFENMVKLVGIMESTISEIKDKITGPVIEQPEKKSSVKTGKLLTPVAMQTAPRNTFLSTKMREIDDAAFDRADIAYQRANSKDKK